MQLALGIAVLCVAAKHAAEVRFSFAFSFLWAFGRIFSGNIFLLLIETATPEHNPKKSNIWFCFGFFIELVLFRKTACAASRAFSDLCNNVPSQTVFLNNWVTSFKFLMQPCTLAHLWAGKFNLLQSANIQSSVGGDSTAVLSLPSHFSYSFRRKWELCEDNNGLKIRLTRDGCCLANLFLRQLKSLGWEGQFILVTGTVFYRWDGCSLSRIPTLL